MTWQEKVAQLESEGRYAEASRVFAFSEPNASYAQKMQFADRLYKKNAFREALPWYEECIGTPIEEEYYYLTENGNYEQDLPKNVLAKLKKGDTMYETRRYKAAMEYYFPFAEISRYAATKTAECYFLLKDYAKAKEIYRVLAQETDEGYFMFMLGECYTHGLGNEYAFEHAAYWYLYALEHGDTYAYYPLGLAYQFGRGVECDPQKSGYTGHGAQASAVSAREIGGAGQRPRGGVVYFDKKERILRKSRRKNDDFFLFPCYNTFTMKNTFTRTKIACYTVNVSMSVVGNLSPLLFITFHDLYGISYSLLGLLVLVNFCTQLCIDLIFSFFSNKFNIPLVLRVMPALTLAGLALYALAPVIFPSAVYLGLVLGTILFSVSGGLAEVLISPVIAAIPADNPEREMSKLHSVYAWGVVAVILFGTLFLLAFGQQNWQWLTVTLMLIPLLAFVAFLRAEIPQMQSGEKSSGSVGQLKNKTLWLCVVGIFLGGASECTMAQWASGYLEQALSIPKVWGDIFGVALFSLTLGLGRSLYAKFGKNAEKILLLGSIGAAVCYLVAALSNVAVLGLSACALTGLCVSMLWPGSLIVSSERIPDGGVFVYALMAAGGDLGGSVGPQLVGLITDGVAASPFASELAASLNLTAEQIGMKCGMLVGAVFPLLAIAVFSVMLKTKKKRSLYE